MGIKHDLQSWAKSSVAATQMFTSTYEADLGWPQWSELMYVLPPHSAPGSGSVGSAACWHWGALLGTWHLWCLHGRAQDITWRTLFASHLPIHVTAWSLLLGFYLLVQENYAADELNKFWQGWSKKIRGKHSDFSLKLELLFIWATFRVWSEGRDLCFGGEPHRG